MKVSEFINEYTSNDVDISDYITTHYSPIEVKKEVAERIVRACYYDENGNLRRDSVGMRMLEDLALLDLYTCIERGDDVLYDYNTLKEVGVFDDIATEVNDDYQEFHYIVYLAGKDIEYNETEPHGFVRNQVERFGNLVGNTLGPILEGMDTDKIGSLLAEFEERIKAR